MNNNYGMNNFENNRTLIEEKTSFGRILPIFYMLVIIGIVLGGTYIYIMISIHFI